MRDSPGNVRYEEYEKVMVSAGFRVTRPRSGSSHVSFRHPSLRRIITVKYEPVVKKGYVRLALEALDELGVC
ncbi:MAG: type II toxin-antitoxin system HicA family toxin [Bacillota bacterium]|nr:MAG: type II toxin-antitoxin system HicA family toxin [Bacillota bacterium]